MSVDTKNTGLRGIPVADTRISNINGKLGKLIYRGYDIEDLAEKSTFEETAYLLLHDHLPTKARYNKFLLNLNDSRVIPSLGSGAIRSRPLRIRCQLATIVGTLADNIHCSLIACLFV